MASSGQHNEVIVEQILKALQAEQHGDNRWRGLCPSHDDHSPSLDIYVNADGYPGFSCLSKHCKHIDIVKAIKTKFNITVPSRKSGGSSDKIQSAKVLYPAHEPTFPLHMRKDEDTIYEYVTASGEPAFFVQRYMDGKNKQTPAWFSVEYVSDGGRVERAWSSKDPPNKDRPLYNLYELTQNPDKKVLVVEGEKTADAAADYKQLVDFVVVTWSGGSNRVKASDWSVLRDRNTEIYLWPDHDAEGIKAMKEVAKFINNGVDDQRISLLDFSEFIEQRIDKGWDLADGCANMICDYPFEELWGGFKPYYVNEQITNETLEEALAKRDKWYRKLRLGSKLIYLDMRYESDSPFGVEWTDDSRVLAGLDTERVTIEVGDRTKIISAAKEWCDTRGDGNAALHNVVFDPTTIEKEIISKEGLKILNTFPGFPEYPTENKTDELTKAWLEHLEHIVNDDEKHAINWIIDWFADIIQHPAHKPGTALALIGGQGVGKSVLIHCVAALLGNRLTRMITKDIVKYNIELIQSLLVIHDEWSVNHIREKPYWETLKNAITNTRIRVEAKHVPAWESSSFCRFAFTSNTPRPMDLPPDDRRFTAIHCNSYWLKNKDHFENIFRLLKDKHALSGFLDFFKARKITSDLTIGCSTVQKDMLWTPENKVLAACINWANGDGLPAGIEERIGVQEASKFGDEPVRIPRKVMSDFFGNMYNNKADVPMLQRIMPGPIFKRGVTLYDKRGAQSREQYLVFDIPKLQEFRINIEKELSRNYPWNDKEILSDPSDVKDSNVIPLRRDIKDSPV